VKLLICYFSKFSRLSFAQKYLSKFPMSYSHETFDRKASKVYSFLDKDKDGFVSLTELRKGFEQLKLPFSSQDELFQELHVQENQGVSQYQFRQYAEKQYWKLKSLFDEMDFNKDHKITPQELLDNVRKFDPTYEGNDEAIYNLFNKIDKNHDGAISFDEWCNFLILIPKVNIKEIIKYWRTIVTILDPNDYTLYGIGRDQPWPAKMNHPELMNWFTSFGAGFLAGLISRTTMAPLDRLKLIYQTHYKEGRQPPSILFGLRELYRRDGFKGLFRGNLMTVIRAGPETSIKLTVNEKLKALFAQNRPSNKPTKADSFIAGAFAGVIANILTFPLGVLRTRLAASPPGTYSGVFDAIHKMRVNEGKITPFYRGLQPALISVVPNSGLQFMAYETLKRIVIGKQAHKEPGPFTFMCIGGLSALFSNTIMYPLQMLTSRLVMQGVLEKQKKGLTATIQQTLSAEGPLGFYKGYRAAITKIVLGNGISFGFFEAMKQVFGIDFRKKRH